ncbi:MAG TPA: TolC family protein [Puia sp.]|nr:TolC family protein [Puia sp.]
MIVIHEISVQVLRSRITGMMLLFLLAFSTADAQSARFITIDQAWRLAERNYPLTARRQLLAKARDFSIQNAARGWLPQLNISGQATLQSDVTNFPVKLPIPGFSFPDYSKDQYRVYAEADQALYDGGAIRDQRLAAVVSEQIDQKTLEVDLYSLRDRIDQLYFGILLLQQQVRQNALLQADILNGMEKTAALVDNGTAIRSAIDELNAQLIQTDQQRIQQETTEDAYLRMLGLLIGLSLDRSTVLGTPPAAILEDRIARPELEWYELQKRNFDVQDAIADAALRPRLSLFLQGGYARPGLNMLSNNFEWYYLGGVRLSWSLAGLYTHRNERRISELGRRNLDLAAETFVLNTRLSLQEDTALIRAYSEMLRSDARIIVLRTAVKHAAFAQLAEGVMSAHDYLAQVDAEDQARQAYILHQIQCWQAQYNFQDHTGNHP